MATKALVSERDEARQRLRELINPDRPVMYTVLRHVSSSGMSRDISLFVVHDGELRNVTWLAARAMGETCRDRKGQWVIRVHGCGMDMGFSLVYNVSSVLHDGHERAGYVIRHEWA